MNTKLGDPSKNIQHFTDIKLNILCCRYWKLDLWDCHDMAFPFWRIYWNKNSGGILTQNGNVYKMGSNNIYIISPFTSFSTKFTKNHQYNQGINVSGRHISQKDIDENILENSLLHLFIHFNLGIPFDNAYPGIYKIKVSPCLMDKLNYLTERLKVENTIFYATYTLKLQSIINEVLSNIGPELFKTLNIDDRILSVVRHVENNISDNPSNEELAKIGKMATNSFSRLFRQKMNMTLHSFILKRKIAFACEQLAHSNKTIKEVAFMIGFSDRYHFSRVFKTVTGTTPGVFKSGNFS